MRSSAFSAFRVCLPLFVLSVGAAIWNPRGEIWSTVEPPKAQCEAYDVQQLHRATTLTSQIYDVQKLNRVFREPQNTISNLAFIFVGVAVLTASRRAVSRSLGLACIFLGIGSGLYHASLLPEWRMIDILGVYAALFALLALAGCAVFRVRGPRQDFVAALLAWGCAVPAGVHRNAVRIAGVKLLDSTYVVVTGIALASAAVVAASPQGRHSRRYFPSIVTLVIAAPLAFFGGIADRFGGMLANPDALVQGHSVWHTMGAVSLMAAYEIYASTGFDRSVFDEKL